MLARERRLHRLLDGLEITPNDAQCALCGYDEPAALMRVPRRLLELHGVGGHVFGGPEILVCKNCHYLLTLAQQSYPNLLRRDDLPREVADALYLLGQADVQDRLAAENRKRAYASLEKVAQTPKGRRLLGCPRTGRVR